MLRTVSGDLLRDDADALVNTVNTAGVMGKGISIAIPPLGCGHGGLAWAEVEPLIQEGLASVAHRVDIHPSRYDVEHGSVICLA